jgi:hypothetical protein
MVKLVIEVKTPGNGKSYEFRLDGDMPMERAKTQIISSILETENNAISIDPQSSLLCDETTQTRLPADKTLSAAGVKSGHRLILV